MAVNYFLSTIGNDVEAFNNYATFRQATADNTSPIPGYLVAEVNAITHENNGSNCKAVVNYFISRLQDHSPLVKIKVLKLLLHVAKNGHKNVLEELKIHEVSLKQAQNFSTAVDVQSDRLNADKVRKCAEELLVIVFSEEQNDDLSQLTKDLHCLSGLGSVSTSKTLVGFGSSASFNQKTFRSIVSEQVSQVMDKILSPSEDDSFKKQAEILAKPLPSYNPVSISKTMNPDASPKARQEYLFQRISTPSLKEHVAGKAGGGWDDSDDETSDIGQDFAYKDAVDESSSQNTLENKTECPANFEWLEEQNLVSQFLVDQPLEGLRYQEINSVCKKASLLNVDKICEILVENLLSSKVENIKLRSLILIEYLLHKDILGPDSVATIAIPHLRNISQNPHGPVEIKCKKICLIVECHLKQTLSH